MSDGKPNLIDELNDHLCPFLKLSKEGTEHIQSFIRNVNQEFNVESLKLTAKKCYLFEGSVNFKAENIYSAIFPDIKKDAGTVCFIPKFDVTDKQSLTKEVLTIDNKKLYYGKVTLGEQTVLYILRWDQEKHTQSMN